MIVLNRRRALLLSLLVSNMAVMPPSINGVTLYRSEPSSVRRPAPPTRLLLSR